MKTLALDIETAPATVYTWKLYQPIIGVDQIIHPGGIMCYASKWVGQRGTTFRSNHHDGHDKMIASLHHHLDHADAVLHFNGTSFDIPHINREFMENGLTPPSPYKQIDLYRVVKRQARFLSNKLAHVAPQLGLDHKESTGGFGLWKACLAGDEKAWSRMRKYNIRDVTLLEDAYNILRPWITNHPSHAALTATDCCTRCAGTQFTKRGFNITATGRYQRIQCKTCGGWDQETTRISGTKRKAIA